MKKMIGITAFLFAGLLISFFIGFRSYFDEKEVSYDDDQEGIGQQIVIKFSHVVAENTPKGLAAQKFAELVEKKSNHRVKVEVFPNGSLYTDKEEMEAMQDGDIQMIAPATSKLGGISSRWQALDLPFAFPTEAAINDGLNGKIGQSLLASLHNQNIKGLGFWVNGLKQITNKKHPMVDPSDFKGKRIRIMSSGVLERQFELLGAQGRPMDFNETYKHLEAGQIDGEENTISNIYSKKYYNVQDYMTISNHGFLGYAILMNEKYWNTLPKDVQVVIQESIRQTVKWNETHYVSMNRQQLQSIKRESSIHIHELTPKEKEKWMQKLNPIYEEYKPIAGKQLIEEIRALQKKYE